MLLNQSNVWGFIKTVYGEDGDSTGEPVKTFDQAAVDRIVQDRLKSERATAAAERVAAKQSLERLETLSSQLRGTAEAKAQLESEIEDLRGRALTADELKTRAVETAKTQAATELAVERKQSDYWQTRFKSSTLENQLHAALISGGAEVGTLEVAKTFLAASARIVDTKTENGLSHEVRVHLASIDKDGRPIQLDLSPTEAVAKMKETVTLKSLFQTEVKSGAGSVGSSGKSKVDPTTMSDAEYMAYRKAGYK